MLGFVDKSRTPARSAPSRLTPTSPVPAVQTDDAFERVNVPRVGSLCVLSVANGLVALLHLALAVATLTVGPPDKAWVEAHTGVWNMSVSKFNYAAALGSVFLVNFVYHFGNVAIWRKCYLHGIGTCRWPVRWSVLAVTYGTLCATIAARTNLNSVSELVTVFMFASLTFVLAAYSEYAARPKSESTWTRGPLSRLVPNTLAHLPLISLWFVMLYNMYRTLSDVAWKDWQYGSLWTTATFTALTLSVQAIFVLAVPRHYPASEVLYIGVTAVSQGTAGIFLLTGDWPSW